MIMTIDLVFRFFFIEILLTKSSFPDNERPPKRNRGKPRKRKKNSKGFSFSRRFSRIERREHNIKRDEDRAMLEKRDNIMNKARWFESQISNNEQQLETIIRGRKPESLPFFDQIKVADINVILDHLNYKLSYCTKLLVSLQT